MTTKTKLLVLDVDNTVFCWPKFFIPAFKAQLKFIEQKTGIPYNQLCKEVSEIFIQHHTIEYPFVTQQLPSVIKYCENNTDRILYEITEPARLHFSNVAFPNLKPYKNVVDTLIYMKKNHPTMKIVALTDAPTYVTIWKLNKMGLLHYFDGIYGLEDPKLPIEDIEIRVVPEILLKHLSKHKFNFNGKIRALPNDYEKPGVKGMKTILIDYDMDLPKDRKHVIYVGDNLKKDIGLADKLNITSVWAKFGTEIDPSLYTTMQEFAPGKFIYRNVSEQATETPKPDHIINDFSEILNIIV